MRKWKISHDFREVATAFIEDIQKRGSGAASSKIHRVFVSHRSVVVQPLSLVSQSEEVILKST